MQRCAKCSCFDSLHWLIYRGFMLESVMVKYVKRGGAKGLSVEAVLHTASATNGITCSLADLRLYSQPLECGSSLILMDGTIARKVRDWGGRDWGREGREGMKDINNYIPLAQSRQR